MKKLNRIIKIFFGICLFNILCFSQQQQSIPWPSLADSPWSFVRGDMQATGRSQYVGPSTNTVIWRKDMPLGVIFGPIIGYNDILYTGTNSVYASGINYLYAIDKSGQDLWQYETETFFANNIAPVMADDTTIYFGSANKSIYALYPNGELKWQVNNIIWGTPHCYITLGKNGDLYIPSADTMVIINPLGVVKEKRTIEGLKGRSYVFSTGGDTVFYFTGGGGEFSPGSLNASTVNGNFLWSFEFGSHNLGTPVVDNSNRVYVFGKDSAPPYNFFLYCIDSNGLLVWRYQVDRYEDYTSPTIDNNGNIIFPAITNPISENFVISLAFNGDVNWIAQLPDDFILSLVDHGLVCDAEGKIYCGPTYGGFFYCLSNEGEILWKIYLDEYQYDSSPAIGSDGTLYIGTHLSSSFQNHVHNLIAIRDTVTAVDDENFELISYLLEQNYPNPFNSTTNIRYSIPQSGRVTFKVYDLMGREVAALIDRYQESGSYNVIFQADNLASGIYFYQLQSGDFMSTKKLIVLK